MLVCKVCHNTKASKHNYYGSNSICASCRGFFMRAVQNHTYQRFPHTHQCVIDSISRSSCKRCRFAKFLEVGMKVSYVKVHQEQCQKLFALYNPNVTTTKNPTIAIDFTKEKVTLEKMFESYWTTVGLSIYYDSYTKNPIAWLEQICQAPQENTQDVGESMAFLDHMDIRRFSAFALNMTKEDGIHEDAKVLFKHNFARLHTFSFVLCFIENCDGIEEFIEYGQNQRSKSWEVEQLMQMYDQHGKKNPQIEYDMYFASPWASTFGIEYEHKNIVQGLINWYLKVGKGCSKIDKCLLMLIQLIFLYNSDGIEDQLKHGTKVKDLLANYSNLLHRYLKSCHSSAVANILMDKGLMLIQDIQRAYELSKYRLMLA